MGERTISLPVLQEHFPSGGKYREPRTAQTLMLEHISRYPASLIEAATGSGKTAVEYAFAFAARKVMTDNPVFLITPNKTILDQIRKEFPDLQVALGRNEHPCLYYRPENNFTDAQLEELRFDPDNYRADQIPCSFLQDCPHRVNQETGKLHTEGVTPCPYLQQKYEAKRSKVVLATMSFYLFTHLFGPQFETEAVVIDEVHQLANVIRNALSYDISDLHLKRSEAILKDIDPKATKVLRKFRRQMILVAGRRRIGESVILNADEIRKFITILEGVNATDLKKAIRDAVRDGRIDTSADRATLKKLETLVTDLRRYATSLAFSIPDPDHPTRPRGALNYAYIVQRDRAPEPNRVQVKLVVRCYYVGGIIRKILPPRRVSLSATIGDPEVFSYETGISDPFISIPSSFPATNTRIYMPNDAFDLSKNGQSQRDLPKTLRKMAKACKQFGEKGIRSLVVVISNDERDRFMKMAQEEDLDAVTYGNGITAKDAALSFRDGQGVTLVGTAANYAEGIDLPRQIAPVIFMLRPSYPSPYDPSAQLEEQRWGQMRWRLWNYRAMQQALQVRGRNVRSRSDVGVTIFMSSQFQRFLKNSLPKHLHSSYRSDLTFEAVLKDAHRLLSTVDNVAAVV